MPIVRPEDAGSQRGLTPRDAAARLNSTEPTVKANVEDPDGQLEGFWEQPGMNRRWTVWEDSVERVAQAGGLQGTRHSPAPRTTAVLRAAAPPPVPDVQGLRDEVRRLSATVEDLVGKVGPSGSGDGDTYWRQRAERLEQVLWKVISAGGELASATADHAATSERLRAAARAQAEALNLLSEQPDVPLGNP